MVKILNLPSTRQRIGEAFGQGIATGTQQLLQNLQQQKMQERQFEQQKELLRLKQEGKQPSFLQTPGGIQATAQLLETQGFNQNDIQQILQTGDEQLVRSVLKSRLAPSFVDQFFAGLNRNFGLGTSAGGVAQGGQGGILNFLNQDPAQQQQQPQAQDGQPIDVARGTPMQELSRDLTALSPTATQAALTQDTNAGAGSAAAAAGRPPGEVPIQIIQPGQVQPELAASQQQPRLAPEQQGPVGIAPALAPPEVTSPQRGVAELPPNEQPLPEQPGLSPEQNEAINGQPFGQLVNTVLRPLGIARPPSQQEAEAILAERDAAQQRAQARDQMSMSERIQQDMNEDPTISLRPTQSQAALAQSIGRGAIQGLVTLPSLATKLFDIATFGKTPAWQASRYLDSIPGKIVPKTVESPNEFERRFNNFAEFATELSAGGLIGAPLAKAFQGAQGLGAFARNVGNFMNIKPATALKLAGGKEGAKALANWFGTSERGEEIAGLVGQLGVGLTEIVRGRGALRGEANQLFNEIAQAPTTETISLKPLQNEIKSLGNQLETLTGQTGIRDVGPLFNELESLAQQGEIPISQFSQLKRTWNNLGFDRFKDGSLSKFAKRTAGVLRDVSQSAARKGGPGAELAQKLQRADALWTMVNQRSTTRELAQNLFRFNSPMRFGTLAMAGLMGWTRNSILGGLGLGLAGIGMGEFAVKNMIFDPTARSLLSQTMNGLVNANARQANNGLQAFDRYMGRRAPTTIRNSAGKQVEVAFNPAKRIMVPARQQNR